jgi:membrane fusion protein (multidrug efflux system)
MFAKHVWRAPLGTAVALLLVLGGCSKPPPALPPPTVLVAPVVRADLALSREFVGTVEGYVDAEIRARVKGFLKTQDYQDGAFVKEGQLLFTIDPAEYVASVAKARAALERAKASYGQAKATADRYRPLAAKQAVSQMDLDDAISQQRAAAATVDQSRAALDQAELDLSYCRISSPVNGVAGTPKVRVGNLVGQGEPTLLTTVSQIDPVRVTFPISEAEYLRIASRAAALDTLDPLDAGAERRILELILADGSVYPLKGWFASLNRQIEKGTGTIQFQTVFPNPQRILRPGQYARVRVPQPDRGKDQLVVPESAVKELQGSYTVAVVGPDDIVHIKSVKVGARSGSLWVVTEGLAAGDRVITEGLQKVSDGMKVTPQPDPAATAKVQTAATGADGG